MAAEATSPSNENLASLKYYDALRKNNSTIVTRSEESNLESLQYTDENGQPREVLMCHLAGIIPFTNGNLEPSFSTFETGAAATLAAHHLNTGNGALVPALEGLNDRCNIRFTT